MAPYADSGSSSQCPKQVVVYTATGDGTKPALNGRWEHAPEAVRSMLDSGNPVPRDPKTGKAYKWNSPAWKALDARLVGCAWHKTPRNCTIMEAEGALALAGRPFGTGRLNRNPTVGRLVVEYRPCDLEGARKRQATVERMREADPEFTLPPLVWQCGVAVFPNRGGEISPPGADREGKDRDAALSMLVGTASHPVRVLIRGRKGDALWKPAKREHTSGPRKAAEEAEFGDAARRMMAEKGGVQQTPAGGKEEASATDEDGSSEEEAN
jgi:hypothetical protein